MDYKIGRLKITAQERRALSRVFQKNVDKPDWRAANATIRALIVLGAAKGLSNAEQARDLGGSRTTIRKWRRAYESGRGIDALRDAPRSGRKRTISADLYGAII